MKFRNVGVASLNLRYKRSIVNACCGDQRLRSNRTGRRSNIPFSVDRRSRKCGAFEPNILSEIERIDPLSNIGGYAGLVDACDWDIPKGPILLPVLNVLPRRQLHPQTADRVPRFEQDGPKPRLSCII